MKINRLSRNLRANRIRAEHVSRLERGETIHRVEAISPVEMKKIEQELPSENYLNLYEHYYKKFRELKKEFRKFYHQEKELLEAIGHLDKNGQKLVKHTRDLIEKYNQALKALADFDFVAGTSHVVQVREVLRSFSEPLFDIGISQNELGFLTFDAKKFVSFLENNRQTIEKTLAQLKEMILQTYKSFTKIQIKNQKKHPYELEPFQYKGLIIEEKS